MKRTQYDSGRLDGLRLGLDIAKKDGIEALEKECQMRGAWGIHTALAAREVDKATEQIKTIKYSARCTSRSGMMRTVHGSSMKMVRSLFTSTETLGKFRSTIHCTASNLQKTIGR